MLFVQSTKSTTISSHRCLTRGDSRPNCQPSGWVRHPALCLIYHPASVLQCQHAICPLMLLLFLAVLLCLLCCCSQTGEDLTMFDAYSPLGQPFFIINVTHFRSAATTTTTTTRAHTAPHRHHHNTNTATHTHTQPQMRPLKEILAEWRPENPRKPPPCRT